MLKAGAIPKPGGSPGAALANLYVNIKTGQSPQTNNFANGKLPTATSAVTGANKSVTNRATGMQSKGGPQQQAASGNIGVVSQGMVNPEVQNDDVVLPYAKL